MSRRRKYIVILGDTCRGRCTRCLIYHHHTFSTTSYVSLQFLSDLCHPPTRCPMLSLFSFYLPIYLRRAIQISFAIDLFLLSSFFFISHRVKRIIERDVRNFYGRRQNNRSIAYYQTMSREKCFCNFSHDHYLVIILQDLVNNLIKIKRLYLR